MVFWGHSLEMILQELGTILQDKTYIFNQQPTYGAVPW